MLRNYDTSLFYYYISIHLNFDGGAIVAEGSPNYNSFSSFLTLVRSPDNVPSQYFDDRFTGKLFLYSNDQEVASYDLFPYDNAPYSDNAVYPVYYLFSDDVNLPGSADIPAINVPDFRPYIRLNRDGLNAKSIEWYFVNSSGTRIAATSGLQDFNLDIWTYYVISWDVASPDLPLVMTVGDTKTITVKLTAKAAGMTSITLLNDSSLTWPREIWIADTSGKVPALTDNINALIHTIVLPEIGVRSSGIYTFRIPVDHITLSGTKLFMHSNYTGSYVMGDYTAIPTPGDSSGSVHHNVHVKSNSSYDILLLTGRTLASNSFTLRASSTDISVAVGSSVNVKLTPLNAVGNVSYAVSDSWIVLRRVRTDQHRLSFSPMSPISHQHQLLPTITPQRRLSHEATVLLPLASTSATKN